MRQDSLAGDFGRSVTMKADLVGSARQNMPLYDYQCHQCGETFEVRQKFADAVLTVHESCGGELERLISLPALQFKGTGWYITDYGRNGKKPAAKSLPIGFQCLRLPGQCHPPINLE